MTAKDNGIGMHLRVGEMTLVEGKDQPKEGVVERAIGHTFPPSQGHKDPYDLVGA